MSNAPTLATHEPITAHIPDEPTDAAVGRPDIQPPSLWRNSVKAVRKLDGYEVIVNRVDHATMMFRAYYLDQVNPKTGEMGRHAERTEWENCSEWNVAVQFTAAELDRQAARTKLADEIAKLDAAELGLVTILCDDENPAKALGKLMALRAAGMIKSAPDVAQAAIAEAKTDPKAPAKR